MLPRLLHLHPATCRRLTRLSKEAERDGAYRVAKRLQAVVLNAEGRTSGELAAVLKAPRSKISEWLAQYQVHVATHPPDGNSQPILCQPLRTRDHADSRFRRDAVPPRTHPLVPAPFLLILMSL